MAKRNVSQAVPVCKPRPEVGEVAWLLANLEDLRVHLERGVKTLEFFNEEYVDDPRELHSINFLTAMILERIAQQMQAKIECARRVQSRLLDGDC